MNMSGDAGKSGLAMPRAQSARGDSAVLREAQCRGGIARELLQRGSHE